MKWLLALLITCGICGQEFNDMDVYRDHNDKHEHEQVEAIDCDEGYQWPEGYEWPE